jgi:hypothetical protein
LVSQEVTTHRAAYLNNGHKNLELYFGASEAFTERDYLIIYNRWAKSRYTVYSITVYLLLAHTIYIYFFVALQPHAGQGLLILEVSRSHPTTHHSVVDSSGRVISSSQKPLPDNTQHSQQTDIHALSGIRTHNPSRRAAADLRLRPHGHWDQLMTMCVYITYMYMYIHGYVDLCICRPICKQSRKNS